MGEVDHSNDAVNHCVANGYQGIGAANGQTINQLLEEVIDLRHYSAPKNPIRISLVGLTRLARVVLSHVDAGTAREPLVTVLRFSGEPAPGSRESGP
nr:hypothetical protein [Pseudomonas sp. Hg5Tf]MDH2557632.1 hypothetical protein [Pseudomonas sp. Hg5Tf]